jgi:hypothetical protein
LTIIALVPIDTDERDKKTIFNPLSSHLASIFDASIAIIADPPPSSDSSKALGDRKIVTLLYC